MPSKSISFDTLASLFHLPEKQCARQLGVCLTSLKKICRSHGISRWPYRKLKSIDKKLGKIESAMASSTEDPAVIRAKLEMLRQEKKNLPLFVTSGSSGSAARSRKSRPSAHHYDDSEDYSDVEIKARSRRSSSSSAVNAIEGSSTASSPASVLALSRSNKKQQQSSSAASTISGAATPNNHHQSPAAPTTIILRQIRPAAGLAPSVHTPPALYASSSLNSVSSTATVPQGKKRPLEQQQYDQQEIVLHSSEDDDDDLVFHSEQDGSECVDDDDETCSTAGASASSSTSSHHHHHHAADPPRAAKVHRPSALDFCGSDLVVPSASSLVSAAQIPALPVPLSSLEPLPRTAREDASLITDYYGHPTSARYSARGLSQADAMMFFSPRGADMHSALAAAAGGCGVQHQQAMSALNSNKMDEMFLFPEPLTSRGEFFSADEPDFFLLH